LTFNQNLRLTYVVILIESIEKSDFNT